MWRAHLGGESCGRLRRQVVMKRFFSLIVRSMNKADTMNDVAILRV